eukprot:GHVQ01025007.1.p1 GENE.GHVQ01025007.1~~GHVQ01025007.1.p1  ORF type:complete len:546 (+),score=27.93 GHVQ01025007.1:285-1922(+)
MPCSYDRPIDILDTAAHTKKNVKHTSESKVPLSVVLEGLEPPTNNSIISLSTKYPYCGVNTRRCDVIFHSAADLDVITEKRRNLRSIHPAPIETIAFSDSLSANTGGNMKSSASLTHVCGTPCSAAPCAPRQASLLSAALFPSFLQCTSGESRSRRKKSIQYVRRAAAVLLQRPPQRCSAASSRRKAGSKCYLTSTLKRKSPRPVHTRACHVNVLRHRRCTANIRAHRTVATTDSRAGISKHDSPSFLTMQLYVRKLHNVESVMAARKRHLSIPVSHSSTTAGSHMTRSSPQRAVRSNTERMGTRLLHRNNGDGRATARQAPTADQMASELEVPAVEYDGTSASRGPSCASWLSSNRMQSAEPPFRRSFTAARTKYTRCRSSHDYRCIGPRDANVFMFFRDGKPRSRRCCTSQDQGDQPSSNIETGAHRSLHRELMDEYIRRSCGVTSPVKVFIVERSSHKSSRQIHAPLTCLSAPSEKIDAHCRTQRASPLDSFQITKVAAPLSDSSIPLCDEARCICHASQQSVVPIATFAARFHRVVQGVIG